MRCARRDLGLVIAQPHRGRCHRLLGQGRPGQVHQVGVGECGGQIGHFAVGAGVVLQDGVTQRAARVVDGDDGRAPCRRSPARHLLGRDAGSLHHLADRLDDVRCHCPVSASAYPGRGSAGPSRRVAVATMPLSVSINTVLVPVVPTSMPMV